MRKTSREIAVPQDEPTVARQALDPEEVEAIELASLLADEMTEAWSRGERHRVEHYLAVHPGLLDHPEAVVRLIYEEVCLHREIGQEPNPGELAIRFPRWRDELEILLDCDRLLAPPRATSFPDVGETLGDFRLLEELGRGALGRTFLAVEPSLADRPVVLKVTALGHHEHLSLARLQHTHIVPIHSSPWFPKRGLRAICMPYLGGESLDRLLATLAPIPHPRRTGRQLLDALDQAEERRAVPHVARSPSRAILAGLPYVDAICWIAACLADALHYAHDRGLVHLDVKPANVLLAADGQPMLLDFHLARPPLRPGDPSPAGLGGTPGYMSPEQWSAAVAIRELKPLNVVVDERTDVYALGLLLAEALGGTGQGAPGIRPHDSLQGASPGLCDIIAKCLESDPKDRYHSASSLATDLRRHLTDLPLLGVANRSLGERWRKWRRRRPEAFGRLAVGATLLAAALPIAEQVGHRYRQAVASRDDARTYRKAQQFDLMAQASERGLALLEPIPLDKSLGRELRTNLRIARRARDARELRRFVDRLRFISGAESLDPERLRALTPRFRSFWEMRTWLAQGAESSLGDDLEQAVRNDLLDLAILWSGLCVRHGAGKAPIGPLEAHREALEVLKEVEVLLGPGSAIALGRRWHEEALGIGEVGLNRGPLPVRSSVSTALDHAESGLLSLRSGDIQGAEAEFSRALELRPQDFWANFQHGVCSYRLGRFAEAVNDFSACIALAPEAAECPYNRALAFAALGERARALRDYDRALKLDPASGEAALNRGILRYEIRDFAAADADLNRALGAGADPSRVHYNLALVHLARKDRTAAVRDLRQALALKEARSLYGRLMHVP